MVPILPRPDNPSTELVEPLLRITVRSGGIRWTPRRTGIGEIVEKEPLPSGQCGGSKQLKFQRQSGKMVLRIFEYCAHDLHSRRKGVIQYEGLGGEELEAS